MAVLKRIRKLLASATPQHYIYESVEACDELEVIRAGGDLRIYCRLVMGVPQEDRQYNVLFVFYVDPHQYRTDRLATFDEAAKQRLREITPSNHVDSADDYLDAMDAFTARDLEDRIDRLEQ